MASEQASLLGSPERETFSLPNPDQVAAVLDRWDELMTPSLPNPTTRSALVGIYPLMRANPAIQAYLQTDPARQGLRQSLPDVPTAEEAADLMSQEYQLPASQTSALRASLKSPQTLQRWKTALAQVSARKNGSGNSATRKAR